MLKEDGVCKDCLSKLSKHYLHKFGGERKVTALPPGSAIGAIEEVNDARLVRKGLHPFIEDPALTEGAKACAIFRAKHHMEGHTHNDFAYLPEGVEAKAGGCAALGSEWGWQSCCQYEDWKYGGAAVVMGDDGLRYMQLFVRN